MTNINSQVQNLNTGTFGVVKRIAEQSSKAPLTQAAATELATAIMKDGKVDAGEADLLDEILSNQKDIKVSSGSAFDPSSPTLSFGAVKGAARETLQTVNRLRMAGDVTSTRTINRARSWTAGADVNAIPSGVSSNRQINTNYDKLDKRFAAYMPNASNWMSYGKYASREAGSQISNLEGAYEMLRSLSKGNVSSTDDMVEGMMRMFSPNGDKASFSPDLAKQGILMFCEITSQSDPSMRSEMAKIAASVNKTPFTTADAKAAATTLAKNLASIAVTSPSIISNMISGVDQLHKGLVEGNTGIYENIAPAYDTFLDAEARGEDGVAALQAAGYGAPPGCTDVFSSGKVKDPQGFVLSAFKLYKEARADMDSGDPTRMAASKDKMHRANLLIGCQEQMSILQRPTIFGNPQMAGLLHAMNGTMALTDANGSHALLPNANFSSAKGWADFETRMGVKEVPANTPGAIQVRSPDGKVHNYVPRDHSDGASQGTISRYFKEALSGAASNNLINGQPRPIHTVYSSVDVRYGDASDPYEAQISSSSVDNKRYASAEAAIAAAKALQAGSYVDSYDYAVVEVNGKFEVREVVTQAYKPDDISNREELNSARLVSDRFNVKAILADDQSVRRF